MESMIMEEVHGIIEGCHHVESGRRDVVHAWLKGSYVDLG